MCANFQSKWTTLTFSTQICPKIDFDFEIQIANAGIRLSIPEIPCVPIFKKNRQLWLFRSKFAQKWILGSEFQKSNSGFGISTSKIPWVPIFSQNEQLWIFRSKFGDILVLITLRELGEGWNELDRCGWSWVEVGARFSNTYSYMWHHKLVSLIAQELLPRLISQSVF